MMQAGYQQGSIVLGAFADGELVGMAGVSRTSFQRLRFRGYVWGVAVLSKFQRQGVGRRLVEEVLSWARQQPDLEVLTLDVLETAAGGARLYRSLGFLPLYEDSDHMRVQGRSVAAVGMRCNLSQK